MSITPRGRSAARAAGLAPAAVTPEDYLPVARRLREMTGGDVIVTLGAVGAMCLAGGEACFPGGSINLQAKGDGGGA